MTDKPVLPPTSPAPQRSWFKRALLVTLGAVGAATAALGLFAYHGEPFQHNTHRLLEQIAQSKAIHVTVIASKGSPNAPTGMQVEGFLFPRTTEAGQLSFDGRLTYENVNRRYNFTLLNDRGFVTVEDESTGKLIRNDCLHRDNLPPIHTFTDALRGARVIDAVSSDEFPVDCSDGKLIEFMFADEPYVFCARDDGASIDAVHGEDIEATLSFLQEHSQGVPAIEMLTRPGGDDLSKCDVLIAGDALDRQPQPSARKLGAWIFGQVSQRAKDAAQYAQQKPRYGQYGSGECSCSGGLKPCLFVHGLGQEYDGHEQDSFPEYWGNIDEQARCCSRTEFMRMDTVNNPWHGDVLATKVCKAALHLASNDDPMHMEDIVLIGHSMGNLIISAAAMKGWCAIDVQSSKFIALQGPIIGSMSSSRAMKFYINEDNSKMDEMVIRALRYFGFCPTKEAMKSLAFLQSKQSNEQLNSHYIEASRYFSHYVSSGLCGTSAIGLASLDSPQMFALSKFSGHTTNDNDGAVDFNSCRAGLSPAIFDSSWRTSTFYKANVNHADGTFRHGDGYWGDDRKPVKWFNCQF